MAAGRSGRFRYVFDDGDIDVRVGECWMGGRRWMWGRESVGEGGSGRGWGEENLDLVLLRCCSRGGVCMNRGICCHGGREDGLCHPYGEVDGLHGKRCRCRWLCWQSVKVASSATDFGNDVGEASESQQALETGKRLERS